MRAGCRKRTRLDVTAITLATKSSEALNPIDGPEAGTVRRCSSPRDRLGEHHRPIANLRPPRNRPFPRLSALHDYRIRRFVGPLPTPAGSTPIVRALSVMLRSSIMVRTPEISPSGMASARLIAELPTTSPAATAITAKVFDIVTSTVGLFVQCPADLIGKSQ